MDPEIPDYINVPPSGNNEGYPYPSVPPNTMGMTQQEQGPPQTYAYPPAAVPVHNEQSVITSQPTNQSEYGATRETVTPLTPSDLEKLSALSQLDRLIVCQQVERLEALLGCETKNKYTIKDSEGKDLYRAVEENDWCTRNCCGSLRPFDIKVKDMSDREVIRLSRPLACGSCMFPCCLQSIEVFAPSGHFAGTVEQEWSLCAPHLTVKDAEGKPVLRIEGPVCPYSLCGSVVEFQVVTGDGAIQVGKISKNWSGLLHEATTDADNFGISFPADLDVRMKAVMLGACFLIDFMFFET